MDPVSYVVLTGASSGVGAQTALSLASRGIDLVLPVHTLAHGEEIAETAECLGARVELVECDLASLRSTQQAGREIAEIARDWGAPSALIMDAGINVAHGPKVSEDGYELTMAVNVLGHFLLYRMLNPLLPEGARVITVGSQRHRLISPSNEISQRLREPEWMFKLHPTEKRGSRLAALRYAESKLACIQLAYEINRRGRERGVVGIVVEPGVVPLTNLMRARSRPARSAYRAVGTVLEKMGQCAPVSEVGEDFAWVAMDDEAAALAGSYVHRRRRIASSATSYDINSAELLWRLLTKMTDPFV